MTVVEVEALLGKADQSLPPLSFNDLHADEDPALLAQSGPHVYRHWRDGDYMITVVFDWQQRVVSKSYSRNPDVSLFRRIVDWAGL